MNASVDCTYCLLSAFFSSGTYVLYFVHTTGRLDRMDVYVAGT